MKPTMYIFLVLIFCLMPHILNAQRINISLPQHSNKEYVFILNKGIKQDTIQKGVIPFTGDLIIDIPQREKGYRGMGSLQINDISPFNVIINNEDFYVNQDADGKYIFKNSPENEYLYSIMQDGTVPVGDTSLYASHFVDMIRYMQQLKNASLGMDLREKAKVRSYALNQLDLDELYTSSIWYNVIDGLIKLSSNQQMLGEDMVNILKRIKSQEVFEHLANNLITITNEFGLDDTFDIIVPYIQESGRIEYPQGNMYMAFALAKVRKGMKAPALEGLLQSLSDNRIGKTLLFFYAPDCDNCHEQLKQLIELYPTLKSNNVRVITISSDLDRNNFLQDIARFPWSDSDKLCDFRGFAGHNFINYGIMSTPTMFLLDTDQRVIKRYALVSDIDFFEDNDKKN